VPTEADWNDLSIACDALQDEMLAWAKGDHHADPVAAFDDTIASLVKIYLTHEDSPFQGLRHHVQTTYERRMNYIMRDFGSARISKLTLTDFNRWYRFWVAPNEHSNGRKRISHAHEQMVYVRQAFRFGKALKLPGCRDAKDILDEMEVPNVKRRSTIITDEQIKKVCDEAHQRGKHSIALAQKIQDGLIVRQKDVIGEWIPISEPGLSDICRGKKKWVVGLRWEEIDEHMTLKHTLSKSLRGRDALADLDAGKTKEWSLPLYPTIMEEMARLAGVPVEQLTRDKLPASGPIVVAEHTGLPWLSKVFSNQWRALATAVGIPKNVQNRDTRAGGATDAETKGGDIEKVRQSLGHARPDTTRIYQRAEAAATAEIAVLRFGKKGRTKDSN
jgi:hypothetical protein